MAELQAQLDQVVEALKMQPANPVLIKLKTDIEEGIQLQNELVGGGGGGGGAAAAAPAASAPSAAAAGQTWKAGDTVRAKYGADGMWYEAVVDSVTDTGYAVVFGGYASTEMVAEADVQPNRTFKGKDTAQTISSDKPNDKTTILSTDTPAQRAAKKKKAKGKKRKESITAQENAMTEAKNSWQSFNSKASSKSKSGFKRGKARQSIFKTPDTIEGRVGVVGSGAGLTHFQDAKKHKFSSVD